MESACFQGISEAAHFRGVFQFRLRFDAVEVAAQGQHVYASHIPDMPGMADDIFQLCFFRIPGEMVGKIQAYEAPFLSEEMNQVIRQVPLMGCYRPGVGVGRHGRPAAMEKDAPCSFVIEVACIHHHMQGFHGLHDFPAFSRDTLVLSFHAVGPADFIGIVPRKGHEADAVFVDLMELFHGTPHHFSSFDGKEGPDFPILLGLPDIFPTMNRLQPVFIESRFFFPCGKEIFITAPHIRVLLPVHPEGEVLDEAASFFQLFQINVEGIFQKIPLFPMIMDFCNRIAVEIYILHGSPPECKKRHIPQRIYTSSYFYERTPIIPQELPSVSEKVG